MTSHLHGAACLYGLTSVSNIPRLLPGAYFCLNMVMITMSTVLSCMVANMFFRGVMINRAPKWLRTVRLLHHYFDVLLTVVSVNITTIRLARACLAVNRKE